MARLSALVAAVAVAALVAVYVARYEPAQRATNRASAPAARDGAPPAETAPPVPVRGLVRIDGGPAAGVEVVIYRVPYIQPQFFPVSGRPTNNAHVIEMPADVFARAATDAEGRFACDVPRGAAYAAVARGNQSLFEADKDTIELVLDLEPRRDIRLTFVDPDGRPVEGARVLVYDTSTAHPPVAQRTTGAAGAVVVALARWDELVVSAPGLAATRVHWNDLTHADPSAGVEAMEDRCVVMARARRIAGHVHDGDGRPLAGVVVEARDRAEAFSLADIPAPWWRRLTRADGTFAFDALDTGPYSVRVVSPGFVTEHVTVWPDDPAACFVLRRTAAVSGIVVFTDGTPAARATVRGRGNETAVAAADGTFRFPEVPPGRCRLRAYLTRDDTRYAAPAVPVVLPEGGDVDGVRLVLEEVERSWIRYRLADAEEPVQTRDYRVPPGTTITRGLAGRRIQDKPGPLRASFTAVTAATAEEAELVVVRRPEPVGVTLSLRDEQGAPVDRIPKVDLHSDGWIVRVRPGSVGLAANPEVPFHASVDVDGFVHARVERPPPDAGTIEVLLRRAVCEVAGHVVTATGEPYRGAVWAHGDGRANGETDADGRFLLRGLAPGPATLFAGVTRRLELTPGRNDLGTIRIPAPVRVRGVVVDTDGRPVWQADVRVHDRVTGRNATRDPIMRTRGDGTFDVTVEPTSDFALRIEKERFATAFAPLTASPRVVLQTGGTIVVHVPEAEAKRSWSVAVRDAREKWRPRSTSRNGRREWALTGVPPGHWEVFLLRYGDPAPDLARGCSVVAGETTFVRLD